MKLQRDDDTLWLEFGVATGSTINYISQFTKGTVYGFDSFFGLPEKWIDGFEQGRFNQDGIPPPVNDNVVLIKGLFSDTLHDFCKEQNKKISFMHIDCDLYSSAKYILNEVKPYINENCIVVFDELIGYPGFNGPTGELRAFYEFCNENIVEYEWIGTDGMAVALKIIKCQ
jgi:hypothetical protein